MAISIVNLKLTLQNVGVLLVLTLKNINIFRKKAKPQSVSVYQSVFCMKTNKFI